MPADQGIIDSVSNDNTKVIAGGPAGYFSTLAQAHTAHLSRLNMIAETALQNGISISQAATASAIKSLTELDAVEAMSNAVIGQQGAKVAQSTPPETAKP
jgi:hypothetical protein